MKAERRAQTGDVDRQQAPLRQSDVGASLLVRAVIVGAQRNDQVVAVIPAEEEDADQGFVILGALRHRVHQAKAVEAGRGKCGRRCAASRPSEKASKEKALTRQR